MFCYCRFLKLFLLQDSILEFCVGSWIYEMWLTPSSHCKRIIVAQYFFEVVKYCSEKCLFGPYTTLSLQQELSLWQHLPRMCTVGFEPGVGFWSLVVLSTQLWLLEIVYESYHIYQWNKRMMKNVKYRSCCTVRMYNYCVLIAGWSVERENAHVRCTLILD